MEESVTLATKVQLLQSQDPNAPRSVAVSTRQKFNLYANVRPIKTYDRLSPDRKLDFVCFREATEGLYAGIEFDTSEDSAIAIRKTTRKGCAVELQKHHLLGQKNMI